MNNQTLPCIVVYKGEYCKGEYTGFSNTTNSHHVSLYNGNVKTFYNLSSINFLQNIETAKVSRYIMNDKVYSYMNKTHAGRIIHVEFRPWQSHAVPHSYDTFAYKLILPGGEQSKWINEESLSLTPIEIANEKDND